MVQPIPDQPLLPPQLARRLTLRQIERGAPELDLMPIPDAVKASRFDQQAICLGLFQDEVFIGYIWLCYQHYHEDQVRCTYHLAPVEHSVFDFDLYLLPEHRMGLGFVGLWNQVNAFLRDRDVRYTFSRLTRFNLASRRAHQHLGWRRVGQAVFFQAWHLELMFATISPYFSASIRRSKQVPLTLSATSLEL